MLRVGQPGQIIILNGPPRSGKSSISAAIENTCEGVWMNLGVDQFKQMTPDRYQPGIGLRPGGERPDLEPLVVVLYGAMYEAIGAHSRLGLNVVVDVGHHDAYSVPRGFSPTMPPDSAVCQCCSSACTAPLKLSWNGDALPGERPAATTAQCRSPSACGNRPSTCRASTTSRSTPRYSARKRAVTRSASSSKTVHHRWLSGASRLWLGRKGIGFVHGTVSPRVVIFTRGRGTVTSTFAAR
jgi:chloramphenicol phosphotransferase-like protein